MQLAFLTKHVGNVVGKVLWKKNQKGLPVKRDDGL